MFLQLEVYVCNDSWENKVGHQLHIAILNFQLHHTDQCLQSPNFLSHHILQTLLTNATNENRPRRQSQRI